MRLQQSASVAMSQNVPAHRIVNPAMSGAHVRSPVRIEVVISQDYQLQHGLSA